MVTTRSQDKSLSTPVSVTSVEVVVPRSTPRAVDSPSAARKIRSTPRRTASTPKGALEMGALLSKNAPTHDTASENNEPTLVSPTLDTSKAAAVVDELDSIVSAGDAPPLVEAQETDDNVLPEESQTQYPNVSLLSQHEGIDVDRATLPERPKLSSPIISTIPPRTHKRFHSEDLEDPVPIEDQDHRQQPEALSHEQSAKLSEDESDGAPEVASLVPSKPARERKKRRLNENDHAKRQSALTAKGDGEVSFQDIKSQADTSIRPTLKGRDPYHQEAAIPSSTMDSTQRTESHIRPTKIGLEASQDSSLQESISPGTGGALDTARAGVESPGEVKADSMPNDQSAIQRFDGDQLAAVPTPLNGSGKGVTSSVAPIGESAFESQFGMLPGLRAVPTMPPITRDPESGSHTEAESATLTINSYTTVPENQSAILGTIPAPADSKNWSETPVRELPLKSKTSAKSQPRKNFSEPPARTTSLQTYRQRLLDRNPRTDQWGHPGIRRSKFIGA